MLAFIPVNTQTPLFVFCTFAAFIALGSSSGNLSTWSMLTDIYDVDEVITGKRREGIYSGITTFLRKISSGAAVLILGVGLKALGFDQNQYNLLKATAADFDPTAYTKTDVVFGIKWMGIVVPIVLMSVCLFFAIRNRINNRRFDAVQSAISAFHTTGNLDALTPEVVKDVEFVTGLDRHALWGQGKV
jgi:oligogalacturonide transporter